MRRRRWAANHMPAVCSAARGVLRAVQASRTVSPTTHRKRDARDAHGVRVNAVQAARAFWCTPFVPRPVPPSSFYGREMLPSPNHCESRISCWFPKISHRPPGRSPPTRLQSPAAVRGGPRASPGTIAPSGDRNPVAISKVTLAQPYDDRRAPIATTVLAEIEAVAMAEVSETTVSAIKALAWLGSTLGGGGASRRELSKQPLNAACLPSLCGAGASDSPPA